MSAAKRTDTRTPGEILRAALASDYPLSDIMSAVDVDSETGAMFNWAHAFMLEVNSATMSILFDRFEDDELDQMAAALAAIGAEQTLADWRVVRAAFNDLTAQGMDRLDASDALDQDAGLRPVRLRNHADELEVRLLEFAQANWDSLARR